MSTKVLIHHGIKGQKWGVENGPPYPLDRSDMSSSEQKFKKNKKPKKNQIRKERESAKNNVHYLSDEELKQRSNRLRLENEFMRLSIENERLSNPKKEGKKYIKQLMSGVKTSNDVMNTSVNFVENVGKISNIVDGVKGNSSDGGNAVKGIQTMVKIGKKFVHS